jgi:hypothetical protein
MKKLLIISLVLIVMATCAAVSPQVPNAKYWWGLSTDTKPSDAPLGSRFFALNTGQEYVTDNGTSWYPMTGMDTPTVYNVLLSDNNTEFSQAIPDGTRSLIFNARTELPFYYAYVTGKVAAPTSPYLTCSENRTVKLEGLVSDNLTLYLGRVGTDNITVEIQCWGR